MAACCMQPRVYEPCMPTNTALLPVCAPLRRRLARLSWRLWMQCQQRPLAWPRRLLPPARQQQQQRRRQSRAASAAAGTARRRLKRECAAELRGWFARLAGEAGSGKQAPGVLLSGAAATASAAAAAAARSFTARTSPLHTLLSIAPYPAAARSPSLPLNGMLWRRPQRSTAGMPRPARWGELCGHWEMQLCASCRWVDGCPV